MTVQVALLVHEESQEQEVFGPKYVAEAFGWAVDVVGPGKCGVVSVCKGKYGIPIKCDKTFEHVAGDEEDYDVVVISGGWGAERLRQDKDVLAFVRAMHAAGKVVAAICHGPWVLCSTAITDGEFIPAKGLTKVLDGHCDQAKIDGKPIPIWRRRKMTCYRGMKDDLIAAGAEYVDTPVVTDGNVVTAPHYDQVPQFMQAIRDLVEKRR